jgi:hypothetical protein
MIMNGFIAHKHSSWALLTLIIISTTLSTLRFINFHAKMHSRATTVKIKTMYGKVQVDQSDKTSQFPHDNDCLPEVPE